MGLEIIEYAKHNLESGEKIQHQTGTHPIILLNPCLLFLVGVAVMVVTGTPNIQSLLESPIETYGANPLMLLWPVGAYMTLQAAIMTVKRALTIMTTEITVTTRRVIWKTGLIWRNTDNISRARIEGCRLSEQSWLGQWLNYGTVEVKGIGGNVMDLSYARDPKNLQSHLNPPPTHSENRVADSDHSHATLAVGQSVESVTG
ncbi:MAG: Uncharacterized protein AWU57_328, partial [Marinobacter sp. T13-3]